MTAISNSEMAAWTRDPRMWFIRYYLGFVPAHPSPAGNSQQGIRIHTALECLYQPSPMDPLAVLRLLYTQAIEADPGWESELRKEWDLSKTMVEGYMAWVVSEGIDADWKVTATEEDVQVPLPGVPGCELRARFDQTLQQISTGFVFFLDFKNSGNFEKHSILELDPQFKTYCLMSYLRNGIPLRGPQPDFLPVVNGGVIRTLRRCKRTEKAKPPFYMQDVFRYNGDQLEATLQRAQRVCGEIMHARLILDEAYRVSGGDLAHINQVQRYFLRPVPMIGDCSWRCELANSGLCVAMDDGSDWPGMLTDSGHWKRADPYGYYERGSLAGIREQLAAMPGSMAAKDEGE